MHMELELKEWLFHLRRGSNVSVHCGCDLKLIFKAPGSRLHDFFVFFFSETKPEGSTVVLGSLLEVYKLSTYLDVISNLYTV
jgi:hypothetical protein